MYVSAEEISESQGDLSKLHRPFDNANLQNSNKYASGWLVFSSNLYMGHKTVTPGNYFALHTTDFPHQNRLSK